MMGAFVRLAGATSLCCALAGDAHAQAKSAPGGELRYPLSLSVGELSDRFGIGLAMGDEADRPPAFPHVCYGYGGVAVYHLSVSQVFLARYLGRGFTRESLCLALVSGVRFDPDTGRRLPTYVVVFPEWAKTILEEARREKAGRERTRDMLASGGAVTEELPLVVPDCFKNGTPYLDCSWKFGWQTGRPISAATQKAAKEFGLALDAQVRDALASGKPVRAEKSGRAGYLDVSGHWLGAPLYDGQPDTVIPSDELAKRGAVRLTFGVFSRALPRGYGYAINADGGGLGPSVSPEAADAALDNTGLRPRITDAMVNSILDQR